MSNLKFIFVFLVVAFNAPLISTTSIGIFTSFDINTILLKLPSRIIEPVNSSFFSLNVKEPTDFSSALTVFDLLKSLLPDLVAVIGHYSEVMGSIVAELNIQYYVIDVDGQTLTVDLLNVRRFTAMTNLSWADTPGMWAFNSATSSTFNKNTLVVSSKMAYMIAAKVMMYQAQNPAYPQLNCSNDAVLFTSNTNLAAAYLSGPLIFPYASTESYIQNILFSPSASFANASDNLENIYYTLRQLRDDGYTLFYMDVLLASNLPATFYEIPLNLGLLTVDHLWMFLRYGNTPGLVKNTPDTPGWTVATSDAYFESSLSSQTQNLFFQVVNYLAKSALQLTDARVTNSYNFSVYGPSISRFQSIDQIYLLQVYNGSVTRYNLWEVGSDVLGRTSYVKYLQANLTSPNVTSFINLTSLVGQVVNVGIVVDPPFVMINNVTGQPYGAAIEIIQHLAWYIGFTINYCYLKNYGSTSGVIRYLNSSTNATFVASSGYPPIQFSLGGLYYTAPDSLVINYVYPFITPVGINMVMRNNTADTTWQFTQPFATGIYILLAITLVILPIVYSVLDLIVRNDPNKRLFSPAGSFWYVYGALTLASVDILPTRMSTKVLTLVMVFAYLIIIVAYQAGLITLYFFPRTDQNIVNISSLVTANAKGVVYPVVTLSGSLPWRYMSAYGQSTPSAVVGRLPVPVFPMVAQTISQLINLNATMPLITVVNNFTELLPALQANNNDTNNVVIGLSTMNQWLQNQDCGLRIIEETYDVRYVALATPIGALYASELSKAISYLQKNNTIPNVINFYVVSQCSTPVGSFPLRINDLAGIFYILAGGFAVSLMCAVLQRLYYNKMLMSWRSKAAPLKFGQHYEAKVREVTIEGAIIDIKGQPKTYMIPNKNFAPDSPLPTTPAMNDVFENDVIEIKFFGKDSNTRKKRFVFVKKLHHAG